MPSPWTPAMDDRMRVMIAEDKMSASQIAVALGTGITRDAVIGRCFRQGIKLRAPLPRRAKRRRRTATPSIPRFPSAALPPAAEAGTDLAAAAPHSQPSVPVPPSGDGLIFIHLPDNPREPRFCRHISDAESSRPIEARRCCGEPVVTGESWCVYHMLRVFDLTRTKRTNAAAKLKQARAA